MKLRDLIKVIPNDTVGKIRNKNGYVICDGKLLNDDYEPNFPEENVIRVICTIMVDDGKIISSRRVILYLDYRF